jgi:DNA repair exonuclease SbcCD nuclease subunit
MHTSDTHLREKDDLKTLEIIVDLANFEKCDYLLIAGDFFDEPRAPLTLEGKVSDIFGKFNGFIYLIPGNHDLEFLRGRERLSENSEILNPEADYCERDMDGVELWAVPYRDNKEFAEIGRIPADPKNSVLMLHGSFFDNRRFYGMTDKKYMPVFMEDIDGYFRYAALGHYHNAREWNTGKTTAVYPGSAWATANTVTGRRAVFVTDAEKWKTRRIDLPVPYLQTIELPVNIRDTAETLPEKLEQMLSGVEDKDNARLTVNARGTMPPGFTSLDTLRRVLEDTLNRSGIKWDSLAMEGVVQIAPGLADHSFVQGILDGAAKTAGEEGEDPELARMYALERINSIFVK